MMKHEQITAKLFDCDEIKVSKYAKDRPSNKGIMKIILLVALCILFIVAFSRVNISKIFFAKNGTFQWIAITSIVAIFTFGYSVYSTNKKNKFDIVSKERIRWINDVKQHVAELLVLMNQYYDIVQNCGNKNILEPNSQKRQVLKDKYHDEANQLMKDINFKVELLLMSFADNMDNKQMIDSISDASAWVNSFNKYWMWNENASVYVEFTFDNIPILNLRTVSRDYLIREWHRAQKGE